MNHCMRHFEEPVAALCRTCNRPFCSRCLVFSFGPNKPPYCVGCALTASGVRNNAKVGVAAAATPAPTDRRLERAQRRAEKQQAKAAARARKRLDPQAVVSIDAARPTSVPMPDNLLIPSSRFAAPSAEKVS